MSDIDYRSAIADVACHFYGSPDPAFSRMSARGELRFLRDGKLSVRTYPHHNAGVWHDFSTNESGDCLGL